MSTSHITLKKLSALELFDGRLEAHGVREHIEADVTTNKKRCLTDGNSAMWVDIDDEDLVSCITRYASGGTPVKILTAIAEAFDTDIVSEHQPEYWGFDTQEEWDADEKRRQEKHERQFHAELLKYLRGEPAGIQPGTIGMKKAGIAKSLVEKDPSFMEPANRDKLMDEIDAIYDREDTVKVTLSPADIAAAVMLVTHEDDLPRA